MGFLDKKLNRSALLVFLVAGCVRQNSETGETADSSADTSDSAAPPPASVVPRCRVDEVEPNDNPTDGTRLTLELLGCGAINPSGEGDVWVGEVAGASWLSFSVNAETIGSRADLALVMGSQSGNEAALLFYSRDSSDIHLVWPGVADTYEFLLTENNLLGGQNYTYEILFSQVKEPVSWSQVEAEPNNGAVQATPFLLGDRIFATVDSNLDLDWFSVQLPPGKHTLVASIEAFSFGSAADIAIDIFDADLNRLASRTVGAGGSAGHDLDPTVSYTSAGDELLYVKVRERQGRGGRPYWYVLDLHEEVN